MDIGDVCDYCPEPTCEDCPYVNPCYGCEDYNPLARVCLSDGGCGKTEQEEGEQE